MQSFQGGLGLSMNKWLTTLVLLLMYVTCGEILPQHKLAWTQPSQGKEQTAILVAAGDIADCKKLDGAEATAKLLDQVSGTVMAVGDLAYPDRSEEHTSELQSLRHLVCRLLLEKKQ